MRMYNLEIAQEDGTIETELDCSLSTVGFLGCLSEEDVDKLPELVLQTPTVYGNVTVARVM